MARPWSGVAGTRRESVLRAGFWKGLRSAHARVIPAQALPESRVPTGTRAPDGGQPEEPATVVVCPNANGHHCHGRTRTRDSWFYQCIPRLNRCLSVFIGGLTDFEPRMHRMLTETESCRLRALRSAALVYLAGIQHAFQQSDSATDEHRGTPIHFGIDGCSPRPP